MIDTVSNDNKKEQVVENCCREDIKTRIDAVCEANGETWLDVYKDLEFDKSFASKVRRGIIIPPTWQRIKIAKRLRIDSTVIWKISELVSGGEKNGE